MTSLYSRLFTYRQREGRSPLEDFLTEAFVDLLNRLPTQNHVKFCEKVLLAEATPDVKKKWQCFVKPYAGDLRWKTQHWIKVPESSSQKRPDIVLLSGDRPVLVVECKISAPMGGHQEEDNGGTQWHDQLQIYGKWLCKNGNHDAGLVLLTHLTDPPQGFPKNDEYGVAVRAVARWSGVYKWLREGGRSLWKGARPSADALLDEFVEFLKEKDMTGEDPRGADFAAARLYLEGGAHARIAKAMKAVRERAKKSMPSDWKVQHNRPLFLESQPQEGQIYDWAKNACGNDIGWGVWFVREDDGWFSQRTSYREGAFVYVDVTPDKNYRRKAFSKASEVNTEEWGKDWRFPQSEEGASEQYAGIVKLRPLDEVLHDSRGFTEAFWSWLEPSIKQALEIVKLFEKG